MTVSTWARGFGFALMLALNGSAFGQGIVYINPQSQPSYSMSGTPFDVDIDINGDSVPDFILRTQDSYTSVNNAVLIPLGNNQIVAATANPYVANMNAGDTVGSSLNPVYQWSNTKTPIGTLAILLDQQSSEDGNFVGQPSGYIGFGFMMDGANYYGWMEVTNSVSGDAGIFANVVSWAYESDPNTPITVGAVPEPSTWALLAAGVAFLLCRRLRPSTH